MSDKTHIDCIYEPSIGLQQIRGPGIIDLSRSSATIVSAITGTHVSASIVSGTTIYGELSSATARTSRKLNIQTVTGSHAVESAVDIYLCNVPGTAITGTLPSASLHYGTVFEFKKIDSSGIPYVIYAQSGDLIDGSQTASMLIQYLSLRLVPSGTNWYIV